MSPLVGIMMAVLVSLGASQPPSPLEALEDRPRVLVTQPRPHHLRHELQLDVGVLPLDVFYRGYAVGGGYVYHINDVVAWEVATVRYVFNVETPLRKRLADEYQLRPVEATEARVRFVAHTQVLVKPAIGKLSFFDVRTLYFEPYAGVGGGAMLRDTAWSPMVSGSAGLRLWMGRVLSTRIEVRDEVSFDAASISQTLSIGVGISATLGASNEGGE